VGTAVRPEEDGYGSVRLAAVRDEVEQEVRQKLADDWLRLRLRELRAEFDVVVPGRPS